MSEPAYLDVDQQQWTGRQIHLADVRFDASIVTPKFENQIEFHDPGDVTSQVYLSPSSFPGAAAQVSCYLPAGGGTMLTNQSGANFTAPVGIETGSYLALDSDAGAYIDCLGDLSLDPVLVKLDDNFISQNITIKGPGINPAADRVQRFQDGDGYIALQGSAGGFAVQVGNSTDPPASGVIGAVNRTAQAAAVASTKLTDTTPAGYYLVHYTLEDTTPGLGAGTVQFQINYTDDVGATTQTGAALAMNAVGRDRDSFNIYLASGDITYQTNVVGIFSTAQYALRVRCTYLG